PRPRRVRRLHPRGGRVQGRPGERVLAAEPAPLALHDGKGLKGGGTGTGHGKSRARPHKRAQSPGGSAMFSKDLEYTIGQCYKRAREARDEYMTVEHL